jgi:hypothetical protein
LCKKITPDVMPMLFVGGWIGLIGDVWYLLAMCGSLQGYRNDAVLKQLQSASK